MKSIFVQLKKQIIAFLAATAVLLTTLYACSKDSQSKLVLTANKPSAYSSDVVDKWMTMQLRLMRNATGIPNQAFSRHFAYSGVAVYESLRPGLNGNKEWQNKWNGLTGLPAFGHWKNYYLPANANAALAMINRHMFPGANAADKAAIDSLESALKNEFLSTQTAAIISNSEFFGKAVATTVFNWAETDGYKHANDLYTLPAGEGIWKPAPPAFTAASTPYWGQNRTIISGSIQGTTVNGVHSYSAVPGSAFHQMVKEVYEASQKLTDDQKAMAVYWRDVPGVTSPGHWLSILQQVVRQKGSDLETAALVYALTGTALNDALIRCFQLKFQYLTVRPITYIREVMGHTTWSPYIGTPPHPEYLSNHSALSLAAALVLEHFYGKNQSFTDHTYDYMNLAPRSYPSYAAIGAEAGYSRFYGGIHYLPSIEDGFLVGKKVTENILSIK